MQKIRPLPEVVLPDRGEWRILHDSLTTSGGMTSHGGTNLKKRVMTVPGGTKPEDRGTRLHELGHVAKSPYPETAMRYCAKYRPHLSSDSILGGEDFRISRHLHDQGMDLMPWDHDWYKQQMGQLIYRKDPNELPKIYEFAVMWAANFYQLDTMPDFDAYDMVRAIENEPARQGLRQAMQEINNRRYFRARGKSRMAQFKSVTLPIAEILEALNRLQEALQAEAEGGTGEGEEHNVPEMTTANERGYRWFPLKIETPLLTAEGNIVPTQEAKQIGIEITYPERELLDDKVFADQFDQPQGSAAVDCSGSMNVSKEQIAEFIQALPVGTVFLYSANPPDGHGKVVIAARDGQILEKIPKMPGENLCDLPALDYLLTLPGPHYWISDGQATKMSSRGSAECTASAMAETREFCHKNGIKRYGTFKEALNEITGRD